MKKMFATFLVLTASLSANAGNDAIGESIKNSFSAILEAPAASGNDCAEQHGPIALRRECDAPVHSMAVEICMMGDHLEGECQAMIKNRTETGIHYLQKAAALASLENHPASVRESVDRCIAATGQKESCTRAILTGNPAAERHIRPSQVADVDVAGSGGC